MEERQPGTYRNRIESDSCIFMPKIKLRQAAKKKGERQRQTALPERGEGEGCQSVAQDNRTCSGECKISMHIEGGQRLAPGTRRRWTPADSRLWMRMSMRVCVAASVCVCVCGACH